MCEKKTLCTSYIHVEDLHVFLKFIKYKAHFTVRTSQIKFDVFSTGRNDDIFFIAIILFQSYSHSEPLALHVFSTLKPRGITL